LANVVGGPAVGEAKRDGAGGVGGATAGFGMGATAGGGEAGVAATIAEGGAAIAAIDFNGDVIAIGAEAVTSGVGAISPLTRARVIAALP
jgi:hypothetical protein